MKKLYFLVYAWGSTILYIGLIFWLATVPNLSAGDVSATEFVKILYRVTLYAILLLLVYRSIIALFRNSVTRLSQWKSNREKVEDTTFVLIVETLILIISILTSVIISFVDEIIQFNITGRSFEIKDVLVSSLAVLLTAIVIYTKPEVGEFEVTIANALKNNKK